ncbi:MAG: hypothetical protein GX822_02260 [Alcaligenaceae bacterium]|nr:hypothetical protein [Alcaligenaceae bacterium]
MNNTYTQFIQDKTLSNVSLILTTAGFLVFTVGQLNNFNGQQSITPSSASLSFNYAQNGQDKA